MSDLTLLRFCHAPFGTFGRMTIDEQWIWTVERPWLDNAPFVSCIPIGTYRCGPRRFYRRGYDAIEIRDVPGRTHILFHRANLPSQLAGCVAPNSELGCIEGAWAGIDSASAFRLLMAHYGGREFDLTIKNQSLE
jgi:hypothetical protein